MRKLEKNWADAANVFNSYVKENGHNDILTVKKIKEIMIQHGVEPDVMFQPSDICYNRTNAANLSTFENDIHIFEYLGRNQYRVLGTDFCYSGDIERKPKGETKYLIIGTWENGQIVSWNKDL